MSTPEESSTAEEEVLDLVRFFGSLPTEAKRQYERLAEADRTFGEDVARERAEAGVV